jgi:hypothetical protein
MLDMTNESAAGPKTDQSPERGERISASLEDQFHMCTREADRWLERGRTDEGYLYMNRLDGLLKLVRTSAQLAQVIARIDGVKNRKTNTQ